MVVGDWPAVGPDLRSCATVGEAEPLLIGIVGEPDVPVSPGDQLISDDFVVKLN